MHFNSKLVRDYIKEKVLSIEKFCEICNIPVEDLIVLLDDNTDWSSLHKIESLFESAPKIASVIGVELYKMLIWDFDD